MAAGARGDASKLQTPRSPWLSPDRHWPWLAPGGHLGWPPAPLPSCALPLREPLECRDYCSKDNKKDWETHPPSLPGAPKSEFDVCVRSLQQEGTRRERERLGSGLPKGRQGPPVPGAPGRRRAWERPAGFSPWPLVTTAIKRRANDRPGPSDRWALSPAWFTASEHRSPRGNTILSSPGRPAARPPECGCWSS